MQHLLYSFAVLGVFYGLWISYLLWWVSRPEKSHKTAPINIARCDVCHWPLAPSVDKGCVPGNCSYRPRSITDHHLQSGKRAK